MRRFLRLPYRLRYTFGRFSFRAALFVIAAAILIAIGDAAIRPALRVYAEARANNLAVAALNASIESAAAAFGYGEVVTLEHDQSGAVTALHTDAAGVTRLRTAICDAALESLGEIPASKLSIPLGSVSRVAVFSGKGPRVHIAVVPIGEVRCDVVSSFDSAGINQTRHTITVTVEATVAILLPGERIETEVHATVPVAETILLGGVPNFYAGS